MSGKPQFISIWFFIGSLLVTYGILILGAGIYELVRPPAHQVVLAELHAPIWWGAVLLALGFIYVAKFHPGKR